MSDNASLVAALGEQVPGIVIALVGVVGFAVAYLREWGGTTVLLLTAILALGGAGYSAYYTRQHYRTRRLTE